MRFYLRDLFATCTTNWPRQVGSVTNYHWLVREVEAWRYGAGGRVIWATFNYDGLLDQALEDVYAYSFPGGGADDSQMSGYVSREDWALIKFHGSYDWRRLTNLSLRGAEPANDPWVSYRKLEAEWDSESDIPTETTEYQRIMGFGSDADGMRRLWIPAVMAPLASKSTFECPPTHLSFLESRLPIGDLVYTIGWRAQERHFLGKLASMRLNPPDVVAVTGRGIDTSPRVANSIGNAVGRVREMSDPSREGDPARMGDPRTGFSALAAATRQFADELDELVQASRARRQGRAGELGALAQD